jgi:hypothetical protein
MNAKEFVEKSMAERGMEFNDKRELREFLCWECDVIYEEVFDESRWWDNVFKVAEVDGKLVGFDDANSTGDNTAYENGFEFDANSICFVEPYNKTVTRYRVAGENNDCTIH